MQYTLKNNIIKIDNGDHYYSGEVLSEIFPEEIRDNYEEIINQSFENYSDDKYTVTLTNNFNDNFNQIIINFQYKVKPFSFKRSIIIPVTYHLKDFKDYTNERIEKLENEIVSLKELISKLMKENIINNQIDDSNDEEDNDDEEEEIIEIPIKGKGKMSTVVHMKNGRQVIKNK